MIFVREYIPIANRCTPAMVILSVFALLLTLAISAQATITTDGLNLVLLHTNDMHSKFDEMDVNGNDCREEDAIMRKCFGGFARVAETVRVEREKAKAKGWASLFVVSGDTFQGTPYYMFFKWKPCVDFIKELKPDVMVNRHLIILFSRFPFH